jgi:hypothetical protein
MSFEPPSDDSTNKKTTAKPSLGSWRWAGEIAPRHPGEQKAIEASYRIASAKALKTNMTPTRPPMLQPKTWSVRFSSMDVSF